MIGWYIGLIGVLVGIVGGIYFFISTFRLAGDLRKSISYLVIAASIYVVFSSIMVILGLVRHDINNKLWQIVPILYFVSAVFFVVGSLKLVKLLETLKSEKKIEKIEK